MMVFDHVIVLTPDVEATAERLLERHGLASIPGGRHDGHGTANRIVPLGPDYLELMYVADAVEAAGSPIGRWASAGAARGPHVAALMVRVDDVSPYVERLGLSALDLRRARGDGTELSWRLAGVEAALTDDPRPVFVECRMPLEHHPGRGPALHRVQPQGIAWVEFGGDASRLDAWLGDHDLDIRPVGGAAGPGRVAVATSAGEVVIDP